MNNCELCLKLDETQILCGQIVDAKLPGVHCVVIVIIGILTLSYIL